MSTLNTPYVVPQSKTDSYTVLYTDDSVNFVIATAKIATLYSANQMYAGYSQGAGTGVALGSGRGVVLISNDATSNAALSVAVASGEKMNNVTNGTFSLEAGQQALFLANGVNNWGCYGIGGAAAGGLTRFRRTAPVTSFTDGGGTSGTLDLGVTIPAGALYVQTLYSALVGFAGDVSAVAILGDGSDTDRYVTSTANFFTTAAAGVAAGAPSGTAFHASAVTTVVLTVTTGSDFTLCKTNGNGTVVVEGLYYTPF